MHAASWPSGSLLVMKLSVSTQLMATAQVAGTAASLRARAYVKATVVWCMCSAEPLSWRIGVSAVDRPSQVLLRRTYAVHAGVQDVGRAGFMQWG